MRPGWPASTRVHAWILSIALALAYLIPAVSLLGDHGATWDCVQGEYPYGERVLSFVLEGDEAYLRNTLREPHPTVRSPHPNFDVSRFRWTLIPPFVSVLSAISCRLLWTELGILPALQAHNLVVVLVVATFLCFWVRFLLPRIGTLAALFAGASLVLLPRFLAHSFYNLKDPPEACLYVAAVTLAYLALTRERRRWWILAGIATALSLATRPNAFFIPVQMLVFFLLVRWRTPRGEVPAVRIPPRSFLLGSVAFLVAYYAASPPYWVHPIDGPPQVIRALLSIGNHDISGTSAPGPWWERVSLHAPLRILWTTPPLLLALALLGILRGAPTGTLQAFLLAGLLVPGLRNLIPGMRNYGGVRHVFEFFPFLCAFAGIGAAAIWESVNSALHLSSALGRRITAGAVALCLLVPSAVAVATTYPNGIAYFNSFVGGLAGARERRISDAGDYWCASYWEGIAWISEHADPGAGLFVPHAPWVAEAIAPVRLRPDLHLWSGETEGPPSPLFVLFTSGYHRPLRQQIEERMTPVHEVRVQGAPILFVYRLDPADGELLADLEREVDRGKETRAFLRALRRNRRAYRAVLGVALEFRAGKIDEETAVDRIEGLLPSGSAENTRPTIRALIDLLH